MQEYRGFNMYNIKHGYIILERRKTTLLWDVCVYKHKCIREYCIPRRKRIGKPHEKGLNVGDGN